jgi:hypothetical protein
MVAKPSETAPRTPDSGKKAPDTRYIASKLRNLVEVIVLWHLEREHRGHVVPQEISHGANKTNCQDGEQ